MGRSVISHTERSCNKWCTQWFEQTVRKNNLSSDCCNRSLRVSKVLIKPHRLPFTRILFKRLVLSLLIYPPHAGNVYSILLTTSCRRAAATICPAPLLPLWAPKRLAPPSRPRLHSADRNVAVGSHGQYVPTLTAAVAWRVNAAVSKAAWWPWPLTFWP